MNYHLIESVLYNPISNLNSSDVEQIQPLRPQIVQPQTQSHKQSVSVTHPQTSFTHQMGPDSQTNLHEIFFIKT